MPGETPSTTRTGFPIGWHLALLVVGAVLPSLLFAGLLAFRVVDEERQALDRRLIERARDLSLDIDLELGATIRSLQVLATSELLDDGALDLPRFRAQLVRVAATQPSWLAVVLFDPSGQAVVHTSHAQPGPEHRIHDLGSFAAVLRDGRPSVGNLHGARDGGGWYFPVRVPVLRGGAVRFVLSAAIPPAAINALLTQHPSPEEFTRSVVDASDHVVARTRAPERFVGGPSTPAFAERTGPLGGGEGAIFRSRTLEDEAGYTAVHRSALSRWITCVVVPVAAIEGPLQRTSSTLVGSALVLLLVGGGGAFFLARGLSRAFTSAAEAAHALAHGGDPTVAASTVREVEGLQAALLRSASLLRARADERDQNLAKAEAALAEAEAANRVKDEFLAMLGHELRNPLAPMTTALELLRARGQAGSRELAVIERQTQHLGRLVDDLLDVSRIRRGALALDRRAVPVAEFVGHGAEMASPLLEERGHELRIEVDPPDLAVHGDPARLAQVVANLLTNAAKYTPVGGHIAVTAAAAAGPDGAREVELSVRDDGQGMAPDLLPRVFDLFVQGPRGPDRREGGLGLGLTIVRSLVTAHGGRIEARSAGPGEGSTFTMRLPAAGPTAACAPAPTGGPPRPTPACVLVVDDNVDGAEMLAEVLRDEGHEVHVAHDGPAALEAAGRIRPAVAILDIGLPVMSGYELAERLRRLGGPPPALIALTGYGQARDVERAEAAGFAHHFVKPPDLRALLSAVSDAVSPPAVSVRSG